MGDRTGIPYCTTTLNPVVGCRPLSEGCKYCYAGNLAATRLRNHEAYRGVVDVRAQRFNGDVVERWTELDKINSWRKPRVVFIGNMGDLFHEGVSTNLHTELFSRMLRFDKHTYLLLTKRPLHMKFQIRHVFARIFGDFEMKRYVVPSNIWIGVSAETQRCWDMRVAQLRQIPARSKWVSVEPQIELVVPRRGRQEIGPGGQGPDAAPSLVVCGGESGSRARQFDVTWAESWISQCYCSGALLFMKQLGSNFVDAQNGIGGARSKPSPEYGPLHRRLKHRSGADPSEWPQHLRVRQLPFNMP